MSKKIKIAVDKNIPFLKGVLEQVADIFYLAPKDFTNDAIKNCDALIVRTRTKCNEELLNGTNVKFVASATIGFDHIDTAYCESNKIFWMNAPGCNSSSVEQYIGSALASLFQKEKMLFDEKTIGVIGVGNVGSKVANIAKNLGMKVLLNDPPREKNEGAEKFVCLNELIERSDIITFHVPLNKDGEFKTYHLANEQFFGKFKSQKIIINSSRGEVVETNAIKNAINNQQVSSSIIDVWENEPDIDGELLELSEIATPHIAGYSVEGKANGTAICVNALIKYFNLDFEKNWFPKNLPSPLQDKNIVVDCVNKTEQSIFTELLLKSYNIKEDDARLRKSINSFEKQRSEYPVRREFTFYNVVLKNCNEKLKEKVASLGFNII